MKKIIFLSTLFMAFFTMNVTATESAEDFGHCKWESYFKYPKHNQQYKYGQQVKVQVNPKYGHQDIKFCKLYVDGHFIRTESKYPYEWKNDHKLRQLSEGYHTIKCVIYTKCGFSKYITCKIKVVGHGGGGHDGGEQVCHFNSPFEFGWCKKFQHGYKVCVVKKHGKKYIKVKKCGSHNWRWFNCYGHEINYIAGCVQVKCYDYCHNDGGHHNNCNYKGEIAYKAGFKHGWGNYLTVKFKPYKYQDIKWVELYINGSKVRKESSYPFDWSPSKQDYKLKNLHPGKKYLLKCKIYTKCGETRWVQRYVAIGHSS